LSENWSLCLLNSNTMEPSMRPSTVTNKNRDMSSTSWSASFSPLPTGFLYLEVSGLAAKAFVGHDLFIPSTKKRILKIERYWVSNASHRVIIKESWKSKNLPPFASESTLTINSEFATRSSTAQTTYKISLPSKRHIRNIWKV
jgi:hypothetical protein